SVPPRVARRTRQRIGGGRGVARARSTRAGRPAGPFELGPQIARIRGVRSHRWYTTPPGTRSLLSRRARCRPSRRNSTAEATTAGDSAPSVTSKAPSRVTAPDMPGTSRIHATYSRDGVDSPVSTVNPSSNASTTPSRSSIETRRLNVVCTAFVMRRSTTRSSGASSPIDSSSTLPTVEATTAPRSDTRGAPTGSPSRTARLSAAASRTSALATDTRTLADLGRPPREVGQLGDELLHEAGHDDHGQAVFDREAVLLLAHDRHLVVERPRIVGPDLRPEPVLERGDDPAARGVVLRVGGGDHVQVERQPDDETADLDVALLEDVEQTDLDPFGQVGQLVDRD